MATIRIKKPKTIKELKEWTKKTGRTIIIKNGKLKGFPRRKASK